MSNPILSVQDLKVHFSTANDKGFFKGYTPLKAVDGVSFELRPGQTLGVVGESGCGKSTLGRAILRLVNFTEGTVSWLGKDLGLLSKNSVIEARRDLQIVFQDPVASLDPRMTTGNIIGEPLRNYLPHMSKTERENVVKDMLVKVGLSPQMINRYPHEFSGGQCQRIGIARAMILGPKLVVCDEPVSSLDVSIQAQVVNLLMALQKEFDLALVFISHDLAIIKHISHQILVLYLGKVMEHATVDALYSNPLHPYTQALLSAIPIPDPVRERNKSQIILSGEIPSPLAPPSGCVFRTRCFKATEICSDVAPKLESVREGHEIACHHWVS
ncbi:MAG: oligopeptide ABC transporter ATP-binding protein OppF [Rhodospirillaceae bacterium]|nr:oligopeptide ABC transporter ATP-binding protein OppF [Rhodospirillaceae bacterium]